MIIYNRNGDELIDVPITSSAVRKRVLMGDNYVSLPFSHDTYIDFAPGSYIIYNGLKFEIIDVDKNRPTRNATTGGWDYTLQFDDQERHMTRAIVFWLSQKPREAVFHDTTDLQSFGNLIVENMNAFVPAKNWKMRDLSDELKEGTKLVSFNGDTCWNAVNTIAETFGVEWWTEQSEGYIYLCFGKLEIGTEEDFVEGDVITSIPSRRGDDSNYGTRFYVFGSTRNLTEDYGQADQGGTTNHVSEIRLRLPGGQEYIDARPDMAWNDVVEKFVVFEDIYPKNTDTVTSVEKVKRQTDSGTEYEARVIYAKDTPFLPTDLIPGETLQAVITSGALSGRTFDIQLGAAFDDPDTWNPETNPFDRKFEIVADVETTGEQEIIIPNDNLDIEPGNTFVLTGIKLPGARIGEAEQELLEAGTTWAQKNSKDTSVYDCPTNPVYCQLNDKSYELGQKVRLVNEAQFGSSGRSSRIQGYEKSLDNEYQATYTVGDNTAYSRLGEIEKDIQEAAYAERIGVTNGVGIYLIRAKYDQTQPTDYNAYSAAAADEKFLSRKKNDTAEGIITFAKGILANTLSSEKFVSGNEGKGHSTWIDDDGVSHTEVDQVKARKTVVSKQIEAEEGNVTELTSTNIEATVLTVLDKIIAKDQTLSGKISSAKFLSGLLGYGWMIDTQGNGELHSLSIRSFLEVPELRYNQVQVIGDELWVTAGGVISDVQAADSGRYTITLKLEEGQTNPFAADDILRGIYHVSTGFSTIQMRVDSVAEDGTMTVTPRTPDLVPQKFMNIAKTGNFTNAARQRSILISSKQGRIQFMADVNDWEIAPSMVRMILGDTSGFVHPSFGDTSGYNAFLENILMTGRIFQKSADGTTTKPVAVNKGEWEAGTYYYYDEVTHKGSLWLCTAESTSEEPSASSIDWVEEVASGSGSPGPAGPALRSRGVWSASETYINGGEFRDWVLYGEHNYRYVVKEGVATVPAGTLPTDTAYWTPFNEMEPVATRVLLADDAWIDILSTNGIRIGNNGWELTDGEIRHKTSGLKLTKDGKLVAPNGLSLVVGEENIDDYTQQKIDSVEIGTVNLIDKSEEIVLIAGATQTYAYVQKKLHVCPGDEFALSIENIGISAGNPTEFTVLIIDQNMAKELCRRILTLDNRTAVFEIPVDTEEQDGYILFYAGKAGQTNNNSVTYHKVMLVKGNRPALTWSPSLNDQRDYADQTASDQANEIREEAKATGIYLSEKKIDVVADRFRITSTAGREIMRADADGNRVSMENLDVQAGATIGPVEVTETGLAVKAEDEDLQTIISNQEFGSLSDALGTGKTSIVALTAPSVSQPGRQFDMGTFSAPDATVRILSVSGRVIMMNGLNSVRIYLTKQVGSQWTDLGIELFSMASNSHYDENFTKSVVISSIGNYKIACTAVCGGGRITISNMSGTLQEQVKRMEVRPSTIFGMLNSTQYFLLGREKPSASGSEIFRAKIQNKGGGLEVTSTGVNVDGEIYIDGQTTIKGNASVVGKFSATGEINATGNIQSDTDIEAVRDILIGRYLKRLAIPSEKIPSSMTSGSNYQIADSATCIDAMNKNAINITLPKNPKTGQIVLIRQYSAGYTLKGGGKQIHRAGSTVSEFWNDAYGSLMWIRFDGSYWALNYMPSL